ncbi:MAG TPA: adenine deaminase C-terminal domain-containing protein [Bacillota bacterium]
MLEKGYWRNREMRKHVAIIDGFESPTLVLTDATYLNMYTRQWLQAHIWIYNDRIVYVGKELPHQSKDTAFIDCRGKYIVPGYIEPHTHPFQLYNPEQLALHAARFGTTTLVNDNLMWLLLLNKKKAFSLLQSFSFFPVSMYWWARYDSQSALQDEEDSFNTNDVLDWVSNPFVVQGGELTAWPHLLAGDDRLLYWIQETKRARKPVEGHFPGASEFTLTKMKLLGADADHESISGKDIMKRLQLGYQVGLRYSSIRPDLPHLIEEMLAEGLTTFDNLTMTTDGSTPAFYEDGMMNVCVDVAIRHGVPIEEAYRMASYNAAKHLGLEEKLGSIAPGRIANLNILEEKENPHPESVLAKGEWLVKKGDVQTPTSMIDWAAYGIRPVTFNWELEESDLQFSQPIGLDMMNDVIIKPYAIEIDSMNETLPDDKHDAFLLLIDRYGKWRVNAMLRGFTKKLGGLASSYSTTGDLVFIGKNKRDIQLAWKRLKELGGGIVLVHNGKVLIEIPLPLGGIMYDGEMTDLIQKEKELKKILKEFGYLYKDPVYTILFLSSTHLPYIRITQQGIIDIMKREVLFPATMR